MGHAYLRSAGCKGPSGQSRRTADHRNFACKSDLYGRFDVSSSPIISEECLICIVVSMYGIDVSVNLVNDVWVRDCVVCWREIRRWIFGLCSIIELKCWDWNCFVYIILSVNWSWAVWLNVVLNSFFENPIYAMISNFAIKVNAWFFSGVESNFRLESIY